MEKYTIRRSNEALAAATRETLLQLVTGATRRARILEIGVSFDGVSGTAEPVDVELCIQTTAGTASAVTPVNMDSAGPAAIATAQAQFTVEPTTTNILFNWMVHPQGGLFVVQWDVDQAPRLAVSSRIALAATAAAIVNCSAYIRFEE